MKNWLQQHQKLKLTFHVKYIDRSQAEAQGPSTTAIIENKQVSKQALDKDTVRYIDRSQTEAQRPPQQQLQKTSKQASRPQTRSLLKFIARSQAEAYGPYTKLIRKQASRPQTRTLLSIQTGVKQRPRGPIHHSNKKTSKQALDKDTNPTNLLIY